LFVEHQGVSNYLSPTKAACVGNAATCRQGIYAGTDFLSRITTVLLRAVHYTAI